MKKLLVILQIIFSFNYYSQTKRVEIEAKKVSDNYNVIPLAKEGMLMFYESDERAKNGNKTWLFSKYDTDFKEIWTKEFPVDQSVQYVDYDKDNKNLYLFLGEPGNFSSSGQRDMSGELQILTLNYTNGDIKTFSNRIPKNSDIKTFSVVNNHAILTGNTLPSLKHICSQLFLTCTCIPWLTQYTTFKFQPLVLNYDLSGTGYNSIVRNKEFKGNTYIIGSETNNFTKTQDIVYKNKAKYNAIPEIYIRTYSPEGKELSKINVKGDAKNDLVSAKLVNINKNSQVLIGTFRFTPKLKKRFNPASNKALSFGSDANGLFFSMFEGEKQKFIKYYDFRDLSSFVTILPRVLSARKEEKLMDAVEKKGISYNLLMHDVIRINDQYLLVAEAYYPQYHTEYYTDANGKRQSQRVFDGFRYTHALIVSFDKDGNKLWDHSFMVNDILTFNLKEYIKVSSLDDEVKLMYAHNGYLKTKLISGSKVIEGKNDTPIDTGLDSDKLKSDVSDIEYWYDNYFIAYGYQKIKNTEEGKKQNGSSKRRVYYFNKIGFK